jgi:ADP-ribosyl-[dinitrogen reductase] hydrolase
VELTLAQRDRACGVLLATAAGDALGAGYEFGPPLAADAPVTMRGGGPFGWAPGEWTDDTSMAIIIAEVAATGADLRGGDAQDRIVARWAHWSRTAADVGVQTKQVLEYVPDDGISGSAGVALAAAEALHERTGHTAGNGSLMRTAPVALAYLDDPAGLAEAAMSLSRLTHFDPEAGEACALWSLAIRHAVLTGELDAHAGLAYLPPGSRGAWGARLYAAEASEPRDFSKNGWVVAALQAAWCAITTALVPVSFDVSRESAFHVLGEPMYAPGKLRYSLEHAVRGGRDADTVAAIAGGLLGAACGASAVPGAWQSLLHGWPGFAAPDLIRLAARIVDE